MADFIGTAPPRPLLADPPGRSSSITAGSFAGGWPLSLMSLPRSTSRGTPQPAIAVVHRSPIGAKQELFGGQLFERVLVLPRVDALGFVLTATEFPVEVWNTSRNAAHTLETIAISGVGGVLVANPYGLPLMFAALGSRIYQLTMPGAGIPQIDQDVLFGFDGGISGTDVSILGSRITVFSVAPEWGEGMTEKISFLTDVLIAYTDNEQRRALRRFARRGLKFRSLALTARTAAGMESLLWGWQNQPYGVPFWPDATALTETIAAGSFVIPCDTTDRQFAIGGLVVVWVDEFTFEALPITEVNSGSVVVSSPTQFDWTAGLTTLVVPVFLCRLGSSQKIDRLFSGADSIELEFIGEAQQPAPTPASSLTQYKAIDVLELMPNWENGLGRTYDRSLVTLDPKIGPISVVDKGGSAIVGQEFPWFLEDHAAVTVLRAFLLARFGRLNSFWIPTWDQDLVLATDVGPTDVGISIESEFYTTFMFPTKARRYLAFIPTDGSGNVYREVTAAADNGDGTETLTLDSPTGKLFPMGSTMISFLTLARLASDDTELEWANADLAQAVLKMQEVPREVP